MNVLFNYTKEIKNNVNNTGCNYCGNESNKKINKTNLDSKPIVFQKKKIIINIFPKLINKI